MKKLALVLVLTLITFATNAQDTSGTTVTVVIENVLSDGGTIIGGLHTSDTFMKGNGIITAEASAKAGEVTLTFENIEQGMFAIIVMHDANDNKIMDYEANGMPKENYGTSGQVNTFGPPSFEGSKFEVTEEDQEIRIRF